MSYIINALERVLRDKIVEIDYEIIHSKSEREVAMLWRVRSNIRKVAKALIGHGGGKN